MYPICVQTVNLKGIESWNRLLKIVLSVFAGLMTKLAQFVLFLNETSLKVHYCRFENLPTVLDKIFLDFFTLKLSFSSPQVKRN